MEHACESAGSSWLGKWLSQWACRRSAATSSLHTGHGVGSVIALCCPVCSVAQATLLLGFGASHRRRENELLPRHGMVITGDLDGRYIRGVSAQHRLVSRLVDGLLAPARAEQYGRRVPAAHGGHRARAGLRRGRLRAARQRHRVPGDLAARVRPQALQQHVWLRLDTACCLTGCSEHRPACRHRARVDGAEALREAEQRAAAARVQARQVGLHTPSLQQEPQVEALTGVPPTTTEYCIAEVIYLRAVHGGGRPRRLLQARRRRRQPPAAAPRSAACWPAQLTSLRSISRPAPPGAPRGSAHSLEHACLQHVRPISV